MLSAACYGYTQYFSFQLFRVNLCTNNTYLDTSSYYLVNMVGEGYESQNGTVWLDKKGTYKIVFPKQPMLKFAPAIITDSVNKQLYYEKKLYRKYSIKVGMYAYFDCKGLLNGKHEEVYENGVVQMRGNFKDGIPRDSLTFFHPNGNIYQNVIFLRKKLYIREYDSSSVLSKITNVLDFELKYNNILLGPLRYFIDYNETSYYTNGSVKKVKKVIKERARSKEYYPNKQIKTEINFNSRVDYDINGRVTTRYSWKDVAGKRNLPRYTTYIVIKTSYNINNQKTESIKYSSDGGRRSVPNFNVSNSFYIFYWKQYSDDGKETILLSNSKQEIKPGRWM